MSVNRICIWLGPIGTVIMFVGLAIAGLQVAPPPDAPVTFYTDNRGTMQAGLMIAMFGGALYLPWMAMLARSFKLAEGDRSGMAYLQLAFGVIFTILVEFPYLLLEVAVYRAGAPAAVIQGFVDTAWVMAAGFGYTHFIALLVTGIYLVRERRALAVFPGWLGWLNIACAILSLPSFFAGTVTSGVMAWNGIVAFGLPSVGFFPWYVAWTYVLLRLERSASASVDTGEVTTPTHRLIDGI
ncbi:hypothetical protein BRW65_00905 [Mycobacterium paraffinicum]|uniref:DUF4386 domain-containing protein n=2 Tax=Mycobacterium paraffinicum TaxID=53378 RepID=A0A1Q4I275_9MYCO|nr:hypothetical protein BRW65_00905 [Mycobacterium paraffinicum]